MKIKVPRYVTSDWFTEYFALRQGDFNAWSGWIIEQCIDEDSSYDIYNFSGECLFCPGEFGTDLMCQGTYDGYRDKTSRRILHCGVIIGESDGGVEFSEADAWAAAIQADEYDWRYRSASQSAYCRPCEGGDYSNQTLNRIEDIYSHAGAEGIDLNVEMIYQPDVTKKWFRNFWNSLVPPIQQVGPTEQAPIEPGWDRFLFFYGALEEQGDSVSHSNTGWCHPFGVDGTPCEEHTDCYDYPGGAGTIHVLGLYHHLIGPSETYPIAFRRNGLVMDYFPTPPGQGHIAYYDCNEM